MTEFLHFLLPPFAGKASFVLVYGVPCHEHLTAMVAFEGRYSNMAAHVVLHVAQLAELFAAHVALQNLVESARVIILQELLLVVVREVLCICCVDFWSMATHWYLRSISGVRKTFRLLTHWQRIVSGFSQYFVEVVLVDAAELHQYCNISSLSKELSLLELLLFPNPLHFP